MKNKIILFFFLNPFFLKAQDSSIVRSKYEIFASKTGVLLKTTKEDFEKQLDLKIHLVTSTNVQTNESLKAIIINQSKSSLLLGTFTTGSLYIDIDELPDFIKALKYINQQIQSEKPVNQTIFSYTTNNGVTASAVFQPSGISKGWTVSLNLIYKYLRSNIDGSLISIKNKDLEEVISIFDSFKNK